MKKDIAAKPIATMITQNKPVIKVTIINNGKRSNMPMSQLLLENLSNQKAK